VGITRIRSSGQYEKIWRVVGRIPRGKVATYAQVARLAGLVNGARQVGYALHALPPGFPVPWHRVINAQGRISFPIAHPAHRRQKQLLAGEGVLFVGGKVDRERYRWRGTRSV
jgi:methylated-DNA-protein-cysteine methyltransferase-like protein